jgi:hypothetical protein
MPVDRTPDIERFHVWAEGPQGLRRVGSCYDFSEAVRMADESYGSIYDRWADDGVGAWLAADAEPEPLSPAAQRLRELVADA